MTIVFQEDYDSFYENIYRLVKYGNGSWGAAMCPRPMTPEEREEYEIKRAIERATQPFNEAISLSGKEYGDYIDRYYKATFIKLKQSNDTKGLDALEEKIADEIKYKKTVVDKEIDRIIGEMFRDKNDYGNSSSANQSYDSDWEEIRRNAFKNSWAYKPPKKKSLWDRIKDFFD